MLTPKELADTIRKQLKEFVATLNAIIDVAEGNGQERNDDSPESREARLRATATTIL
jgi:predicted RecB family endonuclease